jgi:integrase
LLARNPAAKVSPPRRESADEGEPAHWSAEQVGIFLDHLDAQTLTERTISETRTSRKGTDYSYSRTIAPDLMARALFCLLATTGMRRGEVCGLHWEDLRVDWKDAGALEGDLTVRRAHVVAGGRVVESLPKTRRGRRIIALDPTSVAALRAWRSQQRRDHLRFGRAWEDREDHVFTHAVYFTIPPRHGVPVRPDWITASFQKLLAGAGLPPLHLHGLRHSWATAALEAGEHLRAVADQLGHADTSVTDRTYTHTIQGLQETTALRVAALISSKRASS